MKKITAIALAGMMLAAMMTSCGKRKYIEDEKVDGTAQYGQSAEEALKEIYSALYTYNTGDICYRYMYPKKAIETLKEMGTYEKSIEDFNKGQAGYIKLMTQKPEIVSVDETNQFTKEQLELVERYFVITAAGAGIQLSLDDIEATDGYEFKCSIKDEGGNDENDVECMIYLKDDGWKNVPLSLSSIEEKLSDNVTTQAASEAAKDAAVTTTAK